MRPLLLALLLTLGSFAAYGQAPDCQFTQTFTATGYGVTVSNQAVANLGTQCVTWRLSYYADNMTALSIQVEGAPDSAGVPGTFAAVPTTACSSTQQPPCTLDGANPLTDANHATVAFRGYYAWLALHVTVFTSGGSHSSITARMYGYKGTSPSAAVRAGSGGSGIAACSTSPPTTGAANSFCSTTAGLYQCQNGSSACTTAGQFAFIGPGPWTRSSGGVISPANPGDSVAIPTTLPGSLPTTTGPGGVLVPVLISTSGPVSAIATGFYINNASGAITYTLPAITSANVGLQLCFRENTGKSGAITLTAPASTYLDVNGAVGSAAGNLVSGGALGDAACVVAIDTTHYYAYVGNGTWTGS